ncbi:MAG: hypothetical protein KKD29_05590 [Candidatus Omnitrophica bacterium]|nr:hypothetical protein [Candidatus Omnitrophota bacterium]MBU4487684.1 hypothetical protein [Candidatus Omnitrophota bacterium]MCG2704811.1 hypothetical protein [Candidatus Omnitrophota bacterium]
MRYIAAILVMLFIVSFALPLYAADKKAAPAKGEMTYADKIRANNQKIATFVADTLKMPYVLVGDFTEQDHEKVVGETKYEGHEYLQDMPEKWHGEGKAVK